MLLQYAAIGHRSFGHAGGVASRGQFLVPGDNAFGQRFNRICVDLFCQAGQQHTAADAIAAKGDGGCRPLIE